MSLVLQPRSIVHLDADAFFASVEQSADPRLRGKPIAVGGEKRGIIASASYEARRFGIYTPMPTTMARRLCPKLILLPGDFEKYELFSRLMFSYAYDFTPDVEIGSIDEGYFDLTATRQPAVGIAETIRRAIRESLKLPVSEGIAGNKLVSQIASKLKKPSAFEFVAHGHEAEYLSPLPNKWLPGIGPKTAVQLNSAGLAHIGQIAQTPAELLGLLVGRLAPQLRSFARGIDERPIIPVRAPAKSYGEQETFEADTTDEEFLDATLRRMADKLMAKVREDDKSIRTVTVKVRYNDMDEQQASESLPEPTDLETDIYDKTSALLRKAWQRRVSLRLVSLRLSNVYDGRFHGELALDVSARQHSAQQQLAGVVDQLRQKYGRSVVLRGHDFILRERCQQATAENPKSEIRNPKEGRNPKSERAAFPDYNVALATAKRAKSVFLFSSGGQSRGVTLCASKRPGLISLSSSGGEGRGRGGPPAFRIQSARHPATIPLNVHSYYSFLDSTLSVRAIVDLAKRHELPAIALTDKNNLHGAVEFAQAAAEAGIKPIIGAELNCEGRQVCLYVENEQGYHNLCRLLTQAPEGRGREGPFNFRGSVRKEEVEFDQCLLASAATENAAAHPSDFGFRPAISDPSDDSAKCAGRKWRDFGLRILDFGFVSTTGLLAVSPDPTLAQFFPGRFYLQINSIEACEKRAPGLPCVASLPIHYELPADRWKYDVVQSIRTLTLLRQAHPEKRLAGEYHFRPNAEMRRLLAAAPELLAHTREIAERCSFTFSLGKPQFPGYAPPDGSTPGAFLRRLVMAGLQWRYPNDHARLKPQLEEELAIITDVGYEEYFLVMWDILQECRRRGIEWITRGSAADSLACYCLGISGVCPIRFDLYFRRFLNKDRMALHKLPDIDVDFPHDRKDDVIDLIFEKYGPSHAAVVGGFSTFQARSAFAEVAKVLGVSDFQVRRLTERFPHFARSAELADTVADSQECRDLPIYDEPYATALKMAQFLDGFPRYPKMHPCGVVLSRQPMHEITPCFVSAKGYPTTHFDMDSVEAVGLVKMDILAQGGLAVMRDVKGMLESFEAERLKKSERDPKAEIRKRDRLSHVLCSGRGEGVAPAQLAGSRQLARRTSPLLTTAATRNVSDFGIRVSFGFRNSAFGFSPSPPQSFLDLDALAPWHDPEVWRLIAGGDARAVHHIESPAMISLCKMCNVGDIDTLIAIVSVIRPGAANESKKMEFARRYQRLSPVRYPHPSLEPCLRSTYGLVVYEEHILQICEAFAGLPPGRADVLRRALGKNKADIITQIESEFADCARRRGRSEAEIAEVWGLVVGFRGYAFCKAHSTAYGVEAYQAAWLKRYYPVEFMAAVLSNGKGFYRPLVYILECHRLGIPLMPPSVNEPGPAFRVLCNPKTEGSCQNPKAIRVPVLLVKGLTNRTKDAIIREREREKFSSLADFFLRVQPLPEEMEALIRVGAFDEFGRDRTAQYWESKSLERTAADIRKPRQRDWDHGPSRNQVPPLPCPLSPIRLRQAYGGRGGGEGDTTRPSVVSVGHLVSSSPPPIRGLAGRAGERRPFLSSADRFMKSPSEADDIVDPAGNAGVAEQLWLLPPGNVEGLSSVPLAEPGRLERLRAEEELLGYAVSGHPLELFPNIAWETYCPIDRLNEHIGEQIITCGLVIEQRLFHQVTGEPMKFLTIADWTGIIETELFARTYQSYGLNTVRYRVLEITAIVEPFENGRGHTLRVLRAGKPRVSYCK
ncbi:MAG TPA: DNA polymerase IV [Verrucomicrobiae bacterium]